MATQREILELLMRTSGEADVAALREAIDQLGRQSDDAAGQAGKLEGELNRLAGVASDVAKAVTLKGALNETTAQLEAARAGLDALNAEFEQTDRSSPAVNRAFRSAEKAVADLTARQREQQLELAKTTGGLQKAGVDTDNLAKEYDRLEAEIRQSTVATADQAKQLTASQQAAKQLAERYEQLSGSLRSAAARVNEIAGNMVKLGAAAGAALAGLAAFGAARFFQAGIQDAAAFESALGRIQARSGLAADEIRGVKDQIEEISLDASKGVLEGAAAFEALAAEGSTAEQALLQLRPTLDFATAAGLGTAEAVATLSAALDAFQEPAERTGALADLIAQGALSGGTAVKDLSAALTQAGPAAQQARQGIEATVAQLALLAQRGIEGGRAGSALRDILIQLQDPSSALSKQLDELGISTRSLDGVIAELGKRGVSAEAVFTSLGGRSAVALRALAQDGGAALQALRGELEQSAGAASRAAEIINTDLATSTARLQQAFEQARRQLTEPLLGPLAAEIDSIAEAIRDFTQSPDFARIQAELPQLFAAGSKAVREFIRDVDLSALAAEIATFAANAGSQIRDFADDVGYAKDAVVTTARAIAVAVNGFQAFINATAVVVSRVLQAGAQLDVTVARLGVASAALTGSTQKQVEAAENLQRALNLAESFGAAARENYEDLGRNVAEMVEAFDKLAGTSEGSGRAVEGSLNRQGSAAVAAAPPIRDLTEVIKAYEAALKGASGAGDANADAIRQQGAGAGEVADIIRDKTQADQQAGEQADKSAGASKRAAEGAQQQAGANRKAAQSSRDAADGNREQAESADVAKQSMNDLSLALSQTSEEGLRAYMDANRAAIVSARMFAERVNEVTARIREQEEQAASYVASLRAQIVGADELAARVENLRNRYRLLSEARLREIAEAELALERQREALQREIDQIDSRRARSGAELAAQRQREIDAELKRLAEIERQLSFRDQREREIIAARRRELEAERVAVERNADARVDAELGADRRIREAREAEARANAQAAAAPAAAGMLGGTPITINISGVMAASQREFVRGLMPELESAFRRLDYLRR